jgi:hypothetical protein
MDAPAPAIVTAIAHATGARIDEIPATPERLLERLSGTGGSGNARGGGTDGSRVTRPSGVDAGPVGNERPARRGRPRP